MSKWTYIKAMIIAECFNLENKNRRQTIGFLNETIKKYPSITGSESNANLFINVDNNFDNDSDTHSFLITIMGSLRDRSIKTTLKEYNALLRHINNDFLVVDHMYKIDDGCSKTRIYASSQTKKKKIYIESEKKMSKKLDQLRFYKDAIREI